MRESHYDKTSEISDNSIDLKVFKGGLGLSKENSQEISNKSSDKGGHTSTSNINKNKILTENKNINPNDGILSFRSKKQIFLSNTSATEDTIDSISITKQIIDKIVTLKPSSKKNVEVLYHHKAENMAINRVFEKSNFNQPEELEKEIKNFDIEEEENHKEVFDVNLENNQEENDLSSEEEEAEAIRRENEKNIFWNLKGNIHDEDTISEKSRSKSVNHCIKGGNNLNKLNSTLSSKSKEINRKETFLSSIICTLSHIEKGKAIFVSAEDFIFVLPALFVPRNLHVGNTYSFRISEYEKFTNKIANIAEIQKKHAGNLNVKSNLP